MKQLERLAQRMNLDVPSVKTINDYRSARAMPSVVPAMLIRKMTKGAVDLDQWVDDYQRFGKRKR